MPMLQNFFSAHGFQVKMKMISLTQFTFVGHPDKLEYPRARIRAHDFIGGFNVTHPVVVAAEKNNGFRGLLSIHKHAIF